MKNNKKDELNSIRHTLACVMAYAVKNLFSDVRYGNFEVVEDGFYYDFELQRNLIPDDLIVIESKMKEILSNNYNISKEELYVEEAKKLFSNQPYKIEVIEELVENQGITKFTICSLGEYFDICNECNFTKIENFDINSFKISGSSGAYWKNKSDNTMLQRIYCIAWNNEDELKEYNRKNEDAAKRDHRVLGTQLELFSSSQVVGQGLVLWHPKGAMIRYLLEKFNQEAHILNGYDWVYSPHIGRAELWETSGHLQFYKDSMYKSIEIDNEEYYLKPMSCPFHILIYNSSLKSYKDLPIRYAEYGTVYRYELSGALQGLTRVRGFTQDDAHIICTPEQINEEIKAVLKFSLYILNSFGLSDFKAYIATKPEKKCIGSEDEWNSATQILKEAVIEAGLLYEVDEGGGAFYGPKIDLKLRDAFGREWQCSTIQYDFNLPQKFNMTYIGSDGAKHVPMMVHRALFGSLERFFAMLIEHYNGDFPLWFAPVQIGIIPINNYHYQYSSEILKKLRVLGVRAKVDLDDDKMKAKIRKMELEKIPIIFVIGDKEKENNGVSVRTRKEGNIGFYLLEEFLEKIKEDLDKGIPKYILE